MPDLLKAQENLAQEEMKQKIIADGFEAEIKARVEKRLKVEQDLLEAGRAFLSLHRKIRKI